ncbi:enoyl-CoA hydratase-related protein [Brevibacillus sp. SAFN-007a]|uniref:enoyl-CoA hydratase-related protein n=1 Tax=Brevibacillus sp. SAFN-007a TaxID=3436862 RepID=UPI003F7FA8E0
MTSVARAMACITHSERGSMAEGLEIEWQKFAELFATADAKEGIQAFIEKRKPHFTHS